MKSKISYTFIKDSSQQTTLHTTAFAVKSSSRTQQYMCINSIRLSLECFIAGNTLVYWLNSNTLSHTFFPIVISLGLFLNGVYNLREVTYCSNCLEIGLGRATFFMVRVGFWACGFGSGQAWTTENFHGFISGCNISYPGCIWAAFGQNLFKSG